MNPRGTYELKSFGKQETRNENVEEFAEQMQRLQEDVKARLQQSSSKYKERVDMMRKEKEFQVGDLVMVYLRK